MHKHAHRHRLGTRWSRPVSVLLGTLLLASCASKPVPKPPVEPPPPPPKASRPTLHASWSFETKPDACLATAAAGSSRLVVAVRRKQPIRLRVTFPTNAEGKINAHFNGPAGAWTVPGWHAGKREVVFTLGRGMDSLSRVLMLLSGGVMDIDSPKKDLPIFNLSASGAEGQQWFACARKIVI